jgi:isocitrate/isopropylmalate dehydrogenase
MHDVSCRLEAAVMETFLSGDKSVLTPDIGGTGNTQTFADAVCEKLN